MALSLASTSRSVGFLPARHAQRPPFTARPTRSMPRIACQASQRPDWHAGLAAAVLAAGLLSSAIVPEEALAARSGGRAGGSSFSSRRSAPRAAPQAARTGAQVNNYYSAPPLVGGYGYGGGLGYGYGGGFGMSLFPSFILPLGGILQLFVTLAVISVIINVVSGIFSGGGGGSKPKGKDDEWDDL